MIKQWIGLGLGGWLGVGGGSIALMATAITLYPQVAQAFTARVELRLSPEPNEDYHSFLLRSESLARTVTQRKFDEDVMVSRVRVIITGENRGMVAPVLTLEVDRNSWRSLPDPTLWSYYYEDSRSLLGFGVMAPVELAPVIPPPENIPMGSDRTTSIYGN